MKKPDNGACPEKMYACDATYNNNYGILKLQSHPIFSYILHPNYCALNLISAKKCYHIVPNFRGKKNLAFLASKICDKNFVNVAHALTGHTLFNFP